MYFICLRSHKTWNLEHRLPREIPNVTEDLGLHQLELLHFAGILSAIVGDMAIHTDRGSLVSISSSAEL